jgi:hypothetical protein
MAESSATQSGYAPSGGTKNPAHLPSCEHPAEFNSILREFLAAAGGIPERPR